MQKRYFHADGPLLPRGRTWKARRFDCALIMNRTGSRLVLEARFLPEPWFRVVLGQTSQPGTAAELCSSRTKALTCAVVLRCLLAISMALGCQADAQTGDTFTISQTYLGSDGHPRFEFSGRNDSYYILYRGSNPQQVAVPTKVQLGSNGPLAIADATMLAAHEPSFFRVRQVVRTEPLDLDGDGMDDVKELLLGYAPLLKDTDSDGLWDGLEDADRDGVNNLDEIRLALNPLAADTDADGWYDEAEITAGSNPASAASRPSVAAYAVPPTAVLRPSVVLPAGATLGAVAASPPVTVLRPAILLPEASAFAAVMAEPEVIVLRSTVELPAGSGLGAVLAQPPITINTVP